MPGYVPCFRRYLPNNANALKRSDSLCTAAACVSSHDVDEVDFVDGVDLLDKVDFGDFSSQSSLLSTFKSRDCTAIGASRWICAHQAGNRGSQFPVA